jgi:hypothetical protein
MSTSSTGPQPPVGDAHALRRGTSDVLGHRVAARRGCLVYDRGMPVSINVRAVHPRKLAAVRREVAPGAVGSAWGPAVGRVWDFIRSQPGLWTDGHNIFLYHHPKQPGAPILCDFGVEVTRTFETAGEVYATETPEGEAAVAVYRGPYDRMNEAYNAIEEWMAVNRRESAGQSWEIYGDPTPDPADTETTVVHLLIPDPPNRQDI